MRLFRPLLLAAAVTALTACSLGEPFVEREETDYASTPEVTKPKLPGHKGVVNVCYNSDTPAAERDALAKDACAVWGLSALLVRTMPWQCRLTVPHLALYACVDPAMRDENGGYINPFEESHVEAWRQTQRKKKAAQPSP